MVVPFRMPATVRISLPVSVLQRVHDGDAARRRGLAFELDAVLRGEAGEPLDVAAEERLVGGHDMLARREGRLEDLGRGVLAADELHHDLDGGIGHELGPVARERAGREPQLGLALGAHVADARDVEVDTVGAQVLVAVAQDGAGGAAAHGAEADDAHAHGSGAGGCTCGHVRSPSSFLGAALKPRCNTASTLRLVAKAQVDFTILVCRCARRVP